MLLKTGKMARYPGKGDNPASFVIGDHAPPLSPFRYMPFDPHLAMLLDAKWFYTDWREPFVAAEWTQTLTAGGTIARTTDKALLFTTDVNDNDINVLQHLRAFTPAANSFAAAYFRLQFSNATETDILAGFWATDASPVASEPTNAAYHLKSDDGVLSLGRTNDAGATGSNTATLITTTVAATDYDFGVVIKPTSASAGTVWFQYKAASSGTWLQAAAKTTDFPAAATRFSMAIQNGSGAARTMTVKRYAFACYDGG